MASQDPRVLVVEDEAVIALEMQTLLTQSSYDVVACGSLQSGLEAAKDQEFDAAVLDINLHGQMSFQLADFLTQKNIPFIFVSGYELEIVPRQHRRRPFVGKPFLSQKLLTALTNAIAGARPLATSA